MLGKGAKKCSVYSLVTDSLLSAGAPSCILSTRPGAEFVLLATRGKGTSLIAERVDQVFLSRRHAHSAKPERVAETIDRLARGGGDVKKIELFARGPPRDGWVAWGDQVASEPTAIPPTI